MPFVPGVVNRSSKFPDGRVQFREMGICLECPMHAGELYTGSQRQGLGINLTSAYDKNPAVLPCGLQGFFQGVHHLAKRMRYAIGPASRYNKMLPSGKGFGKGLEGFPPHDHGVACGEEFKAFKIVRKVPGQVAFPPELIFLTGGSD